MTIPLQPYNDWNIALNETSGAFTGTHDDLEVHALSLRDLRTRIDEACTRLIDAQRATTVPVTLYYVNVRRSTFDRVTIRGLHAGQRATARITRDGKADTLDLGYARDARWVHPDDARLPALKSLFVELLASRDQQRTLEHQIDALLANDPRSDIPYVSGKLEALEREPAWMATLHAIQPMTSDERSA